MAAANIATEFGYFFMLCSNGRERERVRERDREREREKEWASEKRIEIAREG